MKLESAKFFVGEELQKLLRLNKANADIVNFIEKEIINENYEIILKWAIYYCDLVAIKLIEKVSDDFIEKITAFRDQPIGNGEIYYLNTIQMIGRRNSFEVFEYYLNIYLNSKLYQDDINRPSSPPKFKEKFCFNFLVPYARIDMIDLILNSIKSDYIYDWILGDFAVDCFTYHIKIFKNDVDNNERESRIITMIEKYDVYKEYCNYECKFEREYDEERKWEDGSWWATMDAFAREDSYFLYKDIAIYLNKEFGFNI